MICDASPGDVEGGAVIRAGPHERKAERDVHAPRQAEILDGDEALVVVLRDHDVEAAHASLHEDGVSRPWPARIDGFALRRPDCGSDDALLLVAEHAAFAGMRIDTGHGDARVRDPKCPRAIVGETDRRDLRLVVSPPDSLG